MTDELVAVFAIATGFVAGGVLSSFYQLVTSQPARFDAIGDRIVSGVGMVILLMFAGPVVLMRNAIRGQVLERRAPAWMAASALIAAAWSLCSGTVVLQFALALRATLG